MFVLCLLDAIVHLKYKIINIEKSLFVLYFKIFLSLYIVKKIMISLNARTKYNLLLKNIIFIIKSIIFIILLIAICD